nr:hypothetical protein GCM10020093_062330 [Planobispora longispora]
MGCSSPNRQGRVEPVSSPAAPASVWSWSPRRRRRGGEDAAQGGLAEAADGLGGEFEPAALAAEVALLLQLALDLLERVQVVDGRAAERAPDRRLVDVVDAGARVVLAERGLQLGQVGELVQRGHRVAHAQRLVAGEALGVCQARSGRRA